MVWSNYFDDYPCISHELNAKSTMAAVKSMLELLGFAYASDKLEPFGKNSDMLGIRLDLEAAKSGVIVVDNKPSRKEELGSQCY